MHIAIHLYFYEDTCSEALRPAMPSAEQLGGGGGEGCLKTWKNVPAGNCFKFRALPKMRVGLPPWTTAKGRTPWDGVRHLPKGAGGLSLHKVNDSA